MLYPLLVIGLLIFPSLVWAKGKDVLAEVNGVEITQKELEEKLNGLPPQFKAHFEKNKIGMLDELVNQELLLQEAKKQKLQKDQDLVELFEKLKRDLLVQRLVEREVLDKAKITGKEAKAYYKENKDQFKSPAQIYAYHILLADQEQAKKVEQRLAKGDNFQEVAKEVSVGPSGSRGGDLGWVGRGQLVPEFEEVAFELNPGDVSRIVKTQFGFHVILVTEKKDSRQLPFSDVSDQIQRFLQQGKHKELLANYIDALKKKGKVKVFVKDLQ